jgi:hypothetical protein
MVRTLAREAIARSLRIDPMSLRAWYCGDDEEEEEEEEKKREEEEDEDEDDEEEEDEEWKVSRPGKGAVPLGPGGPVPAATSGRSVVCRFPRCARRSRKRRPPTSSAERRSNSALSSSPS